MAFQQLRKYKICNKPMFEVSVMFQRDSFCTQTKKRSGVEGLIEIENPNRVSQKNKKVAEIDINAPRELSRRER